MGSREGKTMKGLVIDTSGGNCPLQIEGTIDGVFFYFRARGKRWSIDIGESARGGDGEWRIEAPYGEWPDAGWMEEDQGLKIVEASCALWRISKAPVKEPK
jgi:hypothetical protein